MNTLPAPETPETHPKTRLTFTSLIAAAAMSACSTPTPRCPKTGIHHHARVVESISYTHTRDYYGDRSYLPASDSRITREIQATEERLWLLRQAEARRRQNHLDTVDPWVSREAEIMEENRILREARRRQNLSGY